MTAFAEISTSNQFISTQPNRAGCCTPWLLSTTHRTTHTCGDSDEGGGLESVRLIDIEFIVGLDARKKRSTTLPKGRHYGVVQKKLPQPHGIDTYSKLILLRRNNGQHICAPILPSPCTFQSVSASNTALECSVWPRCAVCISTRKKPRRRPHSCLAQLVAP